MPRPIAVLCLPVLVLLGATYPGAAAFAVDQQAPQSEPKVIIAADHGEAIPAKPGTRIETDDQADVIRFYVKGQLAAILDETGLHVRDDVNYAGSITDYGPSGFDAHAAGLKGHADAK